jgi:hypothetical protein
VADKNLKTVLSMIYGVLVSFLKLEATSISNKDARLNVRARKDPSLNKSNIATSRSREQLSPVPCFGRAQEHKSPF